MATLLGQPISLGEGRSICPPSGWKASGVIADNPLRLQPGSRVVLYPEEDPEASIAWRIESWLVGHPQADDFAMLLDHEGTPGRSDLESLSPSLIRLNLRSLTEARVVRHRGAGNVLALTYLDDDSGWAGYVLYAPTLQIAGEVQILSYEGLQVPYLSYLEPAMASINSFRDGRLLAGAHYPGA
ncbi:MAG TPA: hypothetical protein V6D08_18875 [Candidatus Obscuribacterales bacterium]